MLVMLPLRVLRLLHLVNEDNEMATYTLKADGTGTCGGGGRTTIGACINNDLAADDVLQVYPGTYTETGTASFDGLTPLTIEFPEEGEVIFDFSTEGGADNIYTVANGAVTFTGNKKATVIFKEFCYGNSAKALFLVNNTTAEATLTFKNIMVIVMNETTDNDPIFIWSNGTTTNIDAERVVTWRCNALNATVAGTVTATFKSCMFLESARLINTLVASTVNLYNCLLVGNESKSTYCSNASATILFQNCYYVPGNSEVELVSGAINSKNSIFLPQRDGTTIENAAGDITDLGGTLLDGNAPATKTWSLDMGGMIGLFVDDSSSYSGWVVLKGACEKYGVRANFSLDHTATLGDPSGLTLAKWQQIKIDADNGHCLTLHTRHGNGMQSLNAFGIQYNGAATTATVSISSTAVTTQLDGAGTDQTWNFADYEYIGDLVLAIDGTTDYRAVCYSGGGSTRVGDASLVFGTAASNRAYTSTGVPTTLATATDEDIKLGTNDAYEAQHDFDLYFDEIINENRNDIDKYTGYRPTHCVYPSGHFLSTWHDELQDDYYITWARSVPSNNDVWMWGDGTTPVASCVGFAKMASYGYNHGAAFTGESETTIKAVAAQYAQLARFTGVPLCSFDHGDFSQQEWEWFIEGILDAGGTIATVDEITRYLDRTVGHTTTLVSNFHVVTRTARDFVDQLKNITLDPGSSLATGGENPLTNGKTYLGLDGEPIANWNCSIGPVQAKNTNFHPR